MKQLDFLKFLNDEQRRRLLDRARPMSYDTDEVILNEGEQRHALFIIKKGSVRVEISHPEFNIEVLRLLAGEIFGEMSFVEGFPASANVIANESTEIDIIDADQVDELRKSDPEFAGCFYHSLAAVLSRRLRDTTLRGLR